MARDLLLAHAGLGSLSRHSALVERDQKLWDNARPWWDVGLVLGVLGAQLAGEWATVATFIVLALLAFLSAEWAIKSAALGGLVNLLNPEVFGTAEHSLLLRWVPLGAVVIRGIVTQVVTGGGSPKWLGLLWIFAIVNLIGSALTSFDWWVSLLSLLAFTGGFAGVRLAFDHTQASLASWFYTLFATIVTISTPLVWRPEGFAANDRGFQGILSHPQVFGVFLAPFAAWLLIRVLLTPSRTSLRELPVLGLVTWLIYLSGARVAGIAIGLGVLAAMTGLFVRAVRTAAYRRQSFVTGGAAVSLAILVVALGSQSDRVRGTFLDFVSKAGNADVTSVEAIVESRRELIERSWENFLASPVLGIGFGLPSHPSMLRVEEVGGWPISAVREKGFIVTAVLEEGGLLGAVALAAFIIGLARTVARQGSIENSVLFWSAFFTSFGEMVFLSPGGVGIYVWLMLGLAATPFQPPKPAVDPTTAGGRTPVRRHRLG
jgi:hypothetical protein